MRREWKVVARSLNTGAFGHTSYIIVARNGEAYRGSRVDGDWNRHQKPSLTEGEVFDCVSPIPDYLGARGFEVVERLPDMPAKLLRKVWEVKSCETP